MNKPFLFFLLILITACNQQGETPDGGPCSYKETLVPVRLIELDSTGNDNWDAFFINGSDTLSFSRLNNRQLSNAEAGKLRHDSAGAASLLVQEIINGHCNPHIETIRLH